MVEYKTSAGNGLFSDSATVYTVHTSPEIPNIDAHTIAPSSALEDSVKSIIRRVLEEIVEPSYDSSSTDSFYDKNGSYRGGHWRDGIVLKKHLDMDGGKLTNVGAPSRDLDAVNKIFLMEEIAAAMTAVKEQIKDEMKKEMLGDGLDALKLRVRAFSLFGGEDGNDHNG